MTSKLVSVLEYTQAETICSTLNVLSYGLKFEGICPICFTTPQLKPINLNEIVFPINNQYIPISEVLSTNFSSVENDSGPKNHNAVPEWLSANNPTNNNLREPLLAGI